METIHSSSFSFFTIPSSLKNQTNFPSVKQNFRLTSIPRVQIFALNHAINATTATSIPHGDISVLIPISSVLLFMYWIANFVVPDIVSKDLVKKASEFGEQKSEIDEYDEAESTKNEPKQKIKKADLKEMIDAKMKKKA